MPPKKKKFTPEALMEMAIEESRLSIHDHIDKTDPLVGAIIATADGEILEKAHRCELRVGEHCEYTLIERKLVNNDLIGCVLYVTLEPCTDSSRGPGKRGCSTHIFRARLGKVYIGIEDPDPRIAGRGIVYLQEQGISFEMFSERLQETIRSDNSQFIREKEEEAKQVETQVPEEARSILQKGAPGTKIGSFSTSTIQQFIETASMPFKYPSNLFDEWALQFGILERQKENIQPTGLGLMLLGERPEIIFPQTVFKVEISYGRGNPEVKDFGGALVRQLPAILDFVKDKALKLTMDTTGGFREEQSDFPFEALREAIANAVIHRDYTIAGATNYLYIDSQRIILRSPGGPPPPLTIQDLQDLDAPSVSRNPKIMYIFNQMRLSEQRGVGLRKLRHLPEEGFPLPTVRMRAGTLEITFGRTKEFIAKEAGINSITKAESEGLLFIQQMGVVSNSQYAAHMGISPKAAQRQLNRLVEYGVITKEGEKRGTRFRSKR